MSPAPNGGKIPHDPGCGGKESGRLHGVPCVFGPENGRQNRMSVVLGLRAGHPLLIIHQRMSEPVSVVRFARAMHDGVSWPECVSERRCGVATTLTQPQHPAAHFSIRSEETMLD